MLVYLKKKTIIKDTTLQRWFRGGGWDDLADTQKIGSRERMVIPGRQIMRSFAVGVPTPRHEAIDSQPKLGWFLIVRFFGCGIEK